MIIINHFKQFGFVSTIQIVFRYFFRQLGVIFESFFLLKKKLILDELMTITSQYDYSNVKKLSIKDFHLGISLFSIIKN